MLGRERVGAFDNFFDLGGHSLLVVKLRNRIAGAMGRSVTVKQLYTHKTIASLAECMQEAAPADGDRPPVVFMFPGRALRPGAGAGRTWSTTAATGS